ncbi:MULTISPECIES: ABC transporter ATP-binding protein [Thermoanaerobacter]|jgi:ABC-2 type transport system ATP-binding protein|uniref:ABC transporter related protein n=1 Tax=Thermoanaerobacter italicus (strain DSM 9252 / Ab9) TaxID=580331 RepID=D3T7Z8_THEIA|nr:MULTISPECIES: ATP-binding cassette domain-containing protein [Thermoanaerobacter]ADD02080.1 ABC transporter related protein [Thermoanaerobacter italicus Ab9]
MIAVKIHNLTKIIGGKTILDNINLELEKGKIYGFFGRNASGKTMLFRAICGLIRPTRGEVKVFGKKIGEDVSFPESLGLIIENVGFWEQWTGFQNLKFLASIKNIITDEDIKTAIKRVGLDPNDKRPYKKYSLGMKQRLGIAQAIMEKPQLLVLDEPTNSLDEEGIKLVRNILLEEKERGATILIASHIKEDIEILSDEKFKVEAGRVYPVGSVIKDE